MVARDHGKRAWLDIFGGTRVTHWPWIIVAVGLTAAVLVFVWARRSTQKPVVEETDMWSSETSQPMSYPSVHEEALVGSSDQDTLELVLELTGLKPHQFAPVSSLMMREAAVEIDPWSAAVLGGWLHSQPFQGEKDGRHAEPLDLARALLDAPDATANELGEAIGKQWTLARWRSIQRVLMGATRGHRASREPSPEEWMAAWCRFIADPNAPDESFYSLLHLPPDLDTSRSNDARAVEDQVLHRKRFGK